MFESTMPSLVCCFTVFSSSRTSSSSGVSGSCSGTDPMQLQMPPSMKERQEVISTIQQMEIQAQTELQCYLPSTLFPPFPIQ